MQTYILAYYTIKNIESMKPISETFKVWSKAKFQAKSVCTYVVLLSFAAMHVTRAVWSIRSGRRPAVGSMACHPKHSWFHHLSPSASSFTRRPTLPGTLPNFRSR